MTCKDCVHCDVCRYNDGANEWCKHPEKCEHFKDKSRFAELPCKVGQTVWRIVKEYNGETRVIEGEVFEITVTHEYGQKFEYRFYFWAKGEEFIRRNYSLWCDFEVFGKTVFLTKEEAEEALKGGEGVMAICKDCLHFNDCLSYGKTRYYGENSACNDVQERCKYFKDKQNFAEICRCKDCLYFEYKVGSYGICEHWHTNSQDIFDLNYCGYAEPRTQKERGGEK